MISFPRPFSEAFISASPEGWPSDCCEWLSLDVDHQDSHHSVTEEDRAHDIEQVE